MVVSIVIPLEVSHQILDECTFAVSQSVAAGCYVMCFQVKLGITYRQDNDFVPR